ncbi:MAG: MarR family transcriptional regulator [Candidatus Methanoperedens sp.]
MPGNLMARNLLNLAIILLLCISLAGAAPENDYKITYTINIKDDGTAIWNVEYRTLLLTNDDVNSFENYTQQLNSVFLPEFKELMQKSASEAANATSRSMVAADFTGDAAVQSTPTGKYGVVHYSFRWTNFAMTDPDINIGDVFIGGLYLSKDNTLIIQYPSGFKLEEVMPPPDQTREGLIWYGLRSFGAGEPRIILSKTSSPWIPLAVATFIIVALGAFIYMRKKGVPKEIAGDITETEMINIEERIIRLLKENGGPLYQSEIVKKLNLPKSTVSSALNELNNKNLILKIKKGRENLIRLK